MCKCKSIHLNLNLDHFRNFMCVLNLNFLFIKLVEIMKDRLDLNKAGLQFLESLNKEDDNKLFMRRPRFVLFCEFFNPTILWAVTE